MIALWALVNEDSGRPHIFPIGDLVEHTVTEDCVCGPSDERLVSKGDGDQWVLVHHRLDGNK